MAVRRSMTSWADFFRNDQDHADAVVKRPVHLGIGHMSGFLEQVKNDRYFPGLFVDHNFAGIRNHADDIFIDAAAGDMGQSVDGQIPHQTENTGHINGSGP